MIKVLQIGMTTNLGGIEKFLINYYENIDREKIQFDFVNMYNQDLALKENIENLKGTIYKVSDYRKRPIKYMYQIYKIVKGKYDIVHCNMNSAVFLYPLIASKLVGAKVVIAHAHNSSSDKGFIKSILHCINKRFIPLFSNVYFACSNIAGQWFFSKKIRTSSKYYIINNAIDIQKFNIDDKSTIESIKSELNIPKNYLVLGHVGRFNKQKNHEFLIDVFYKYHLCNSNSILILVGIGPLQDKIINKVKQLNLQKNVIFLGQKKNINEIMSTFDVFLLPSLYEGLPLVGIEAQYLKKFCIFSNNITNELKISDNAKFLPLEVDNWVSCIRTLKNSDRVLKISNNKFSIKENSKELEKIYSKILKEVQK